VAAEDAGHEFDLLKSLKQLGENIERPISSDLLSTTILMMQRPKFLARDLGYWDHDGRSPRLHLFVYPPPQSQIGYVGAHPRRDARSGLNPSDPFSPHEKRRC
jgi:hypothetical protein